MSVGKDKKEPLRVILAPLHSVESTRDGDIAVGEILTSRPLQDGELAEVRAAVEEEGFGTRLSDGIDDNSGDGKRTFGPPRRWNAKWEPTGWGKDKSRNN